MKAETKKWTLTSVVVILVFIVVAFIVAIGTIAYVSRVYSSYVPPIETQSGTVINQKCVSVFLGCLLGTGFNDTVRLSNGTIIYASDSCQEGGWGGLPLGMSMNFSYYPKEGWIQSTNMCD